MKNALRSQSICILRIPKSKFEKKKHAYSFPIIATNGLHIGPNLSKLCHPLAREGDKKNRCQQHHLVF